jgi:hypothetical protein
MYLNPASWAQAFPMVRAGGLFILIMGASVLLGALLPRRRRSLLIIGAAAATVAIVLLAGRLSAPFGTPTKLQVWALFGSIGAEFVLIRIAIALSRGAGERYLLLAILFAVGLHFLPMAMAFGPACAALAAILCANAGIGLWLRPDVPLNRLWASDGVMKIVVGALMFCLPYLTAI